MGRAGSGGRSGDAAAADAAPVPGGREAAWQEQECDAKHKRWGFFSSSLGKESKNVTSPVGDIH